MPFRLMKTGGKRNAINLAKVYLTFDGLRCGEKRALPSAKLSSITPDFTKTKIISSLSPPQKILFKKKKLYISKLPTSPPVFLIAEEFVQKDPLLIMNLLNC